MNHPKDTVVLPVKVDISEVILEVHPYGQPEPLTFHWYPTSGKTRFITESEELVELHEDSKNQLLSMAIQAYTESGYKLL